ncbi:MAG: prolipoprotein diacylglyceryl transferase [Bacilli bacterium]|nr:prolipoprotein diacylglyceryl transferase [Bacilli bacterium]
MNEEIVNNVAMNRVAIDLGFIQIYWYSIIILIAVLIGATVVYIEAKKQKMNPDDFTDLFFCTVVCGLLGARIYYVIFNIDYYLSNKLEILAVWNGGLAIHGGIIGGALYLLHFCKKRKYNMLKLLDMMVVGLIIAQSIGRWGNFFNQEAFGPATTLKELQDYMIPNFIIDRMKILGVYHEPTFYYESLWNLNGFIILNMVRRLKKLKVGTLTGVYCIYYSIGRLYIESLRMDSLMIGPFKQAQIISILLIGLGVFLIVRNIKQKDRELYHNISNLKREEI